jgi:hypothetical protein
MCCFDVILLSNLELVLRRWELFHGQVSENESPWNTFANPRSPRSLSLENVRFVITDQVVSELQRYEETPTQQHAQPLNVLAHVLSPTRTGVMDELDALIKTKVVVVDDRGIPTLSRDWWTRVDILVLDDMEAKWGIDIDTKGKCGVFEPICKTLYRKWTSCDTGWALNTDIEDIVYEYQEFDEWRMAFTDKQRSRFDHADGIGKFR